MGTKLTKDINGCKVILDISPTEFELKINRQDASFDQYKQAIIEACKRFVEVFEEEEITHKPQIHKF